MQTDEMQTFKAISQAFRALEIAGLTAVGHGDDEPKGTSRLSNDGKYVKLAVDSTRVRLHSRTSPKENVTLLHDVLSKGGAGPCGLQERDGSVWFKVIMPNRPESAQLLRMVCVDLCQRSGLHTEVCEQKPEKTLSLPGLKPAIIQIG